MSGLPGTAADQAAVGEPVALVLSRQARPGHERAFEEVLHSLATAVRAQHGHLDVTVLRPAPGGPPIYTIVSHFQTRAPPVPGWPGLSGRGWSPRPTCAPPESCRPGRAVGQEHVARGHEPKDTNRFLSAS
jgi:hypothetical protein